MHALDALYSLGFIIIFFLALSTPGLILTSISILSYFLWENIGVTLTNIFGENMQAIYWIFTLSLAFTTIFYIHTLNKGKSKKTISYPYMRRGVKPYGK
jgi:hypothetical protein